MLCSNCNAVIPDGSAVCPRCGARPAPAFPQAPQYAPVQGQPYPPQAQQYAPQGQQYAPQGQQYAPPQAQPYTPQAQQYPPQAQQYPPQTPQYPPPYAPQYTQYPVPPKKNTPVWVWALIAGLVLILTVVIVIACVTANDGKSPGMTLPYGTGSDSSSQSDFGGGDGGDDHGPDPDPVTVDFSDLRPYYTSLDGDNTSVTVMVYMIASDLESAGGYATDDIIEMADADSSDNVNIVLEAGGTDYWYNDVFNADSVDRYEVSDGGVELVGELGRADMASPDTLSGFISWAAGAYPADRYILVLWDHGGGAMGGYGYDEIFNSQMSLEQVNEAIDNGGVRFDIIGFDACLMATLETALMLEDNADYLLASEESEPGCGWYYTDWLSTLAAAPGTDSATLATQVIDDFVAHCDYYDETTLSLVDLRYIPRIADALNVYLSNASAEIKHTGRFKALSGARAEATDYGEGEFEQIDMVSFLANAKDSDAQTLIDAIDTAVAARGGSMADSCGLSMYFPYSYLDYYADMSGMLARLGLGAGHLDFFDRFVNIIAGGQMELGFTTSPAATLTGAEEESADYEDCDWYDSSYALEEEEYDYSDYESLEITPKDDGYVLQMSEDAWSNIVAIELQVWYDDGEGYIDLGSDSLWSFDDDGDLMIEFDGTWVAINGEIAPFYTDRYEEVTDEEWYNYGHVPCEVNGQEMELVLYWSNEVPGGSVLGYREVQQVGYQAAKGVIPLDSGDEIAFICDFYTYDGDFENSYYLSDTIICDGSELVVSYEDVGGSECLVFYMLTDIYQNDFWTEPLISYVE